MGVSLKITSLIFFLAVVLLFQTGTFSPIAFAQSSNEDTHIPSWFKNIVKWWKEGKLSDKEILNVIENLSKREIIKLDSNKIKSDKTILPETTFFLPPNKDGASIPSYVKNTFESWEEGLVSDIAVVDTIKFLIQANIIITSPSSLDKQPRQLAAIIDQLHDSIPNERYQEKTIEYLENAGYDVDLYTTEDLTLDFFKNLPTMNYKLIIFRTHSFEETYPENHTFLFTGEKYELKKYIQEQLSGQIAKGIPLNVQGLEELKEDNESIDDKSYFVFGSKMMDELMIGKFPQSVIIIGGCESVRTSELGKSFILRGASTVVGWDRSVKSLENDKVMLALLEEILINKIGIHDALLSLNGEFSTKLHYSSQLNYVQHKR